MSLKVNNLGFYYNYSEWIFRNVNISIEPGEVLGLQGRSGKGKSTLGRIISGYENPKEGNVTIDKRNMSQNGYAKVQLIHQHPEKTMNPRWKMNKILNEGWVVTDKMKEMLEINNDLLNRYPNEISGGEQQRFAIARALGPDTEYLIADEITTMLDAVSQVEIWHGLLEIVERKNLGILAISHDASLLEKVSHRIIKFDDLY